MDNLKLRNIICITDLLRLTRKFPHGIFDLIREPIKQGTGININYPPDSRYENGLINGFDLSKFLSLTKDVSWSQSYYDMSDAAVDYLLNCVPPDTLVISFEMPPWLTKALTSSGIQFIDLCISPLRFGRDLYIAIRCSENHIFKSINPYSVTEEEIRLEASLLAANINMHRMGMIESRDYTFDDIDDALIYVGQAPSDASLLTSNQKTLRCSDFTDRLRELSTNKRLLYKSHPFSHEFGTEEREALESITGNNVSNCNLNAYQILSAQENVELIGISSGMLQEAKWFNKRAHTLFKPFVPLSDSQDVTSDTYQQIHFKTISAPIFWQQILTPNGPTPRLTALPSIAANQGRETLDQWWDYSKTLLWERSLWVEAYVRSGGGSLKSRVTALEKRFND